jgi:hypothetical protein
MKPTISSIKKWVIPFFSGAALLRPGTPDECLLRESLLLFPLWIFFRLQFLNFIEVEILGESS